MANFQTTADILFSADESSLRQVRDQVESIGPVTVEYEPVPRNPAARRGRTDGGMAGRTTGRDNAESILTEIRDLQEDTLIQLEDMSDDLSPGGVGGGGATDLVAGLIGDAGGEAVGATAETLGSTGGVAAGSALGTLAGELIASKAGGGGDSTDTLEDDTIHIADEETPLSVEDATLDVEEPTLSVDKPEWSPIDVDDPSPLGVDDPSPLSVEDVPPIPVDAPDSIPVDVNVSVGASASGGGGSNQKPLPEEPEWKYDLGRISRRSNEFGKGVPGFGHLAGAGVGAIEYVGANAGGIPLIPDSSQRNRFERKSQDYERELLRRAAKNGGGGGGGAQNVTVDITVQDDTEVSVDPNGLDSLKRDVVQEVERERQKDIRELKRELEKMRRSLTGRRR